MGTFYARNLKFAVLLTPDLNLQLFVRAVTASCTGVMLGSECITGQIEYLENNCPMGKEERARACVYFGHVSNSILVYTDKVETVEFCHMVLYI